VEIEAVKHTQFAALSAVAYDSAKSAAAMADQKAVTTDARASVALGDTCESSQQELQQRKWQRWDLKFDEKLNEKFRRVHLRVEVWENREQGIVAVAFGGTVFTDWSDWKANLRWFLPIGTDEYTAIVKDFGPAFKAEYLRRETLSDGSWLAVAKIVSTGHSLGGGLAQQFAYALPLDRDLPRVTAVYAFDPSPVTGFYSVEKGLREANLQGLYIDRVFERGEVLAGLRSFMSWIYPPTAKNAAIRAVRYQLFFSFSPIRSHSIALLSCHLAIAAAQQRAPVENE